MYFISTNSKDFPYLEVRQLYEENEKYNISGNNLSIDDLIKFNEFYAVIIDGKFQGCLYLHNETPESIYLSGFSKRKQSKATVRAISELIKHLKKRYVYSTTPHLHAKICLLRAGFKQVSAGLYRKEI